MGTELYARGVALDRCFDLLNLSNPDVVAQVHRDYIDAGAELVETNTFGANRYKLASQGFQDRVSEVNRLGVELARQVIRASFREVYLAGSVGPLGLHLAPLGRVTTEQAFHAFREQIVGLAEAGVDLFILETFTDVSEIGEAIRATRAVDPETPLVASMTFTQDDVTPMGDDAQQVARYLVELGADAIGLNCSQGPAQLLRLLALMKKAAADSLFWVMLNAGWPENVGGRIMYPAGPTYFAQYACAFQEAGAAIIGGCCGTTPAHIAAMGSALTAPPKKGLEPAGIGVSPPRSEGLMPPDQPSRLAGQLKKDEMVIAVEMQPPKGHNTFRLLEGATLLAESGADVINVADSPLARMRMSAWAMCHLVQRKIGRETVLHFPTRGRNLLRVQGDLLAAHALGIRNLFVIMGDPTAIGDYPEAMDDYDLVPSGLIRLVKHHFNRGVDHAGNSIGQPTSFLVGCALNPTAVDVKREIRLLHRKIASGADFAITQPVFEAATMGRFIRCYEEQHGCLPIPLLTGVLPLCSGRHASFLHNEVPGIRIPAPLQQRIAGAVDAPTEGLRIALEVISALSSLPQIRGVYLIPAFGRYNLIAEIIEAVKLART